MVEYDQTLMLQFELECSNLSRSCQGSIFTSNLPPVGPSLKLERAPVSVSFFTMGPVTQNLSEPEIP